MRRSRNNLGVWTLFIRAALVLLLLSYAAVFVHLHNTQAPVGDFVGTVNVNVNTNSNKQVFPKSPVELLKEKENDFSDLLPGYHALDPRVVVPTISQPTTARKEKQKLQTILDGLERGQGLSSHAGNLWEISEYVPPWMKEYFVWHQHELQQVNATNWRSHRFLVMQCIQGLDDHCGGTADRLKPFLFLLREAHVTKRILLIYWTRPAKLEEFLVPPRGGLDWRAPTWLQPILDNQANGFRRKTKADTLRKFTEGNQPLIRTRHQSVTGSVEWYDPQLEASESTFNNVYHDVWRIFFTPSEPVKAIIEKELQGLIPGQFAAAHLRALYGRVTMETRTMESLKEWSRNALNCASQLHAGGPFLFVSDHPNAPQLALEYGQEKGITVVTRSHQTHPLHLDTVGDWESKRPSDFYDTFVDLLLMGMSKCVTFNKGGFGQWGLLIGYNSSCFINQKTSAAGIGETCHWTEPAIPVTHHAATPAVPLFLPPMELVDRQ